MACHYMSFTLQLHAIIWHNMAWLHMIWHHITWHGITSHNITWHVISYQIMACNGMSYQIMTCNSISWHDITWYDMSCHGMACIRYISDQSHKLENPYVKNLRRLEYLQWLPSLFTTMLSSFINNKRRIDVSHRPIRQGEHKLVESSHRLRRVQKSFVELSIRFYNMIPKAVMDLSIHRLKQSVKTQLLLYYKWISKWQTLGRTT